MRRLIGHVGIGVLLAFCQFAAAQPGPGGNGPGGNGPGGNGPGGNDTETLPKVPHRVNDKGAGAGPGPGGKTQGISYHGGPVILGTPDVYYIWYGGWTNASSPGYDPNAANILNTLANNIGSSNYFKINTTYYSVASGVTSDVSGNVHLADSSYNDNYSQGANLSDRGVSNVVSAYINARQGGHPDPNGVYFVLTSKDVNETSGFCRSYCGWHTYGTMNGVNVKFAFVGNPQQCLDACSMFGPGGGMTPPNHDAGADGMASIISHELEESTTDPLLNAWYDSSGAENADKCAWTFGAVTGNSYNVTLGLNYLIQRNWIYNPTASNQHCTMSYLQ